ncbi:MAG: putative hydrolase of the superfamily [Acidobacteriota bacterium]|jgi:putative hydrolase of the HAD superfamily|nr:putative hydrolase of the superfamily [Acidobacteriota bacterium]
MPNALLIDFDGVLRQWPDSPDWPVQFEITEAEIRGVAFTPTLLQKVILGVVPDEAWRAAIVTGLARSHGESQSQRAVDLWSRSAGVLVPEVAELLRRLPASFRVVLATNATSRLPLDMESLGLSHRFHAVANSSRLGVAKPDPAFFHAALQLAGVAPADALFVDDTLENVSSASRLGIASHHFRSPSLMIAFLEQNNVLVGA